MRTKKIISSIAGIFAFALPVRVWAAITTADTGLPVTATNAGLKTGTFSLEQFVGTVINAVLGIIGVVFLVLVVYGGLLWMLSEGDENKVGKARGLILHSMIGLILVLAAYAVTNFVVNAIITQTVQ